jgi:HK97 family phage major capsid protein
MKSSKVLREEIAQLNAEVEAIVAVATEESRELSQEEVARVDEIQGKDGANGLLGDLKAKLDRATKIEARAQVVLAPQVEAAQVSNQEIRVPAVARAANTLVAFRDERDAYASGQFLRAHFGGNQNARQWCRDHGIYAAMGENDDLRGGVLVPPQFESAIINLKEQYGVFGREARVYPMTSDTVSIPRRVSGVTAYAVSEAQEVTASDAAFGQVNLTARKWATLTRISSELSEDSVVSIADFLAQEIAYAHAVKEDQSFVLGDGTTTYHGIMGLANAIASGSVATSTGETTMGALTLASLEAAVAKLPQFPGIAPKWYFNSAVYWQTGARLQLAAGGVTTQMVAGGPIATLLGYPVVFTQALSAAPTSSQVYAYFGDMRLGSTIGRRRGITVASDASRYFEYDQIAIRSTLRYDINIHETGTASAAGPIIQCKLG